MRKRISAFSADEAGNLTAILPLVVATAIGGALLWNYNDWRANTSRGTHSGLDLRRIGLNILNRTKTALAVPQSPIATGISNTCDGASTINTSFAALRNLQTSLQTTPQSYTYSYNFGSAGTLEKTCLLLDTELPPTTELSTAVLTVTGVPGSDDYINLSRKVDVSVHVVSDPSIVGSGTHDQAQVFDIDQVVTLQAATLADYGLVLYGGGGITTGLPVTFLSPVYDASPGPLLTFATVLPSPASVTFNKRFDMAARGFANGGASVSLSTSGAFTGLDQLFRGGVRNLVYSTGASSAAPETSLLPISDQGPTGTAWGRNVTQYWNGTNLVPIPYLNSATTPPETGLSAVIGAPSPPGAPWAAELTTVGSGILPAGPVPWAGLNGSCTPQSRSAIVFEQTAPAPATFTIQMNSATSDDVVCAFVAAKTVNITVTGNGPVYLFGMIITANLNITNGGGTNSLFIGNPYHDDVGVSESTLAAVLPVPPPAGFSFADLRNEFALEAQTGLARNFMVPILRYKSPLTDPSVQFRPGAMISIYDSIAVPPVVLPGPIYDCDATTANIQEPNCGTEDGIAPAGTPFTGAAIVTSQRSLSTAGPVNQAAWPGNDTVVFRVVDP